MFVELIENMFSKFNCTSHPFACRRTIFGRGSGNQSVKSLTDVASLLQNEAVKNVVVVAGAGISTPSGIPDFR